MSPPRWSLAGLRALIGLACIEAPQALAALHPSWRNDGSPCRLLFASIEAALQSAEWRQALDGLLAALLAEQARAFADRSLYELAALHGTKDGLSPRARLALLWTLGRHPCFAARRIEEHVARGLVTPPRIGSHPQHDSSDSLEWVPEWLESRSNAPSPTATRRFS